MRLTPLLILLPLLSLAAATRAGESAKDTEGPIRVTINAEKTGPPINPFIYGQFIEHLGRCIYGGIWAEMLEDRKFFRPVGAAASPWQPLGGATVQMETEAPFVGDHTPRVTLPGGRLAG